MRKGFTMLEILAVFTITALIILVSVPLVTGLLKKGTDSSYAEFKDTVSLAAEAYIQENDYTISTEISTYNIGDLVDSGYLKSTLVNPYNKEKVMSEKNRQIIIKVYKDNEGVLQYEIEGTK